MQICENLSSASIQANPFLKAIDKSIVRDSYNNNISVILADYFTRFIKQPELNNTEENWI
jgi:hypothetical protein